LTRSWTHQLVPRSTRDNGGHEMVGESLQSFLLHWRPVEVLWTRIYLVSGCTDPRFDHPVRRLLVPCTTSLNRRRGTLGVLSQLWSLQRFRQPQFHDHHPLQQLPHPSGPAQGQVHRPQCVTWVCSGARAVVHEARVCPGMTSNGGLCLSSLIPPTSPQAAPRQRLATMQFPRVIWVQRTAFVLSMSIPGILYGAELLQVWPIVAVGGHPSRQSVRVVTRPARRHVRSFRRVKSASLRPGESNGSHTSQDPAWRCRR